MQKGMDGQPLKPAKLTPLPKHCNDRKCLPHRSNPLFRRGNIAMAVKSIQDQTCTARRTGLLIAGLRRQISSKGCFALAMPYRHGARDGNGTRMSPALT
jgi:hypothetical protein